MTFYSEMAEMATGLITEFGADILVSRITQQKQTDPVTGEVSVPEIKQNFPLKGIIKKYPENLIDGSRITASDRQVMFETSSIKPRLTDQVIIDCDLIEIRGELHPLGGEYWPIMEVEAIEPAGIALLYTVRIRK